MSDALYDRTGREIMLGDVLKVFHFTGRRRKAHYMYKQVVEIGPIRPGGECRYLHISHLSLGKDRPYYEFLDGRVLSGCEIVQSIDAVFYDRPRLTPPPERGDHYE